MSVSQGKASLRGRWLLGAALIGVLVAVVVGYRVAGGRSCEQVESEIAKQLDDDKGAAALALADGAPDRCKALPAMRGRRAEALVRMGKNQEAWAEGAAVLAAGSLDPYATYAVAQAQHATGDFAKARANAQAAVQRGRGPAAQLLLGILAYKVGDYDTARRAYGALIAANPNDVAAIYNLALLDQQSNRYRDAREGYLRVLRLDPNHVDARYNLVLLTNAAGATMEAQHHLRKLEELAPNDPRVVRLEDMLAVAPAASALVVGSSSPPDAAGSAAAAVSR